MEKVGPGTIVWLNEAQHYLMPTDPGVGERLAAGLRALLQDEGRAPVLVLATLWPRYWDTLTVRPGAGEPDPYAQASELLTGTVVKVADTFTPGQVAALATARADARLRYAAEHAEGGRITQYLAGTPELEIRYRTASRAAQAIIQVVIDARRFGHPLALPVALLERAVSGYLNDQEWDSLDEDWLEQVLSYTDRPCMGVRGPLSRIRFRPEKPAAAGEPTSYRLAVDRRAGAHEVAAAGTRSRRGRQRRATGQSSWHDHAGAARKYR